MKEQYKDIVNYEGLYQVSNLGNVKSLPKGDGNGNRTRLLKQEVLSKRAHTNYRRVSLSKQGKVTRFSVHRLVAQHFLPLVDGKDVINHLDNNGENNIVTNLEWCTLTENMKHSSNQGRQNKVRHAGGKAAAVKVKAKAVKNADAIIGTRFGRLTVLSWYEDTSLQHTRVKYKCRCDCGNTVHRVMHNIRNHKQMCETCSRRKS